MTPGLHRLTAEEYHADPCPVPSLSNSIAQTMLERSPRHAWMAHPRLNPRHQREDKAAFDIGRAAHALLTGDPERFAIIDAADWRTKAAQTARDEAYAAGKVPLLADRWAGVQAMERAARAQLARHDECAGAFRPGYGDAEATLIWQEGDAWCRSRLDWISPERFLIVDYKTTGGSADPDQWSRDAFNRGYHIQAAFYRRAVRAVFGKDAEFRLAVQETEPPYALAVYGINGDGLELAERKVERALNLWRWCMKHDAWPAYSAQTYWIEPPPWLRQAEELADLRGETPPDPELQRRLWAPLTEKDAA
jgi:hypothetical protein